MNKLALLKQGVLVAAMAAVLTGCVTSPTAGTEYVNILWDEVSKVESCTLKGTLIASEGHFYDYWFLSDKDMFRGSLNQMRANAHKLYQSYFLNP